MLSNQELSIRILYFIQDRKRALGRDIKEDPLAQNTASVINDKINDIPRIGGGVASDERSLYDIRFLYIKCYSAVSDRQNNVFWIIWGTGVPKSGCVWRSMQIVIW